MRRPGPTALLGLLCVLQPAMWLKAAESSSPPEIAANDNRESAGKLANGVLQVRLELRAARWHPETPTGKFFDVYAFAEEGKAPEAPGPLIRVPEGTEIRLSITNRLAVSAKAYGLHAHPGDANDGITLAPGETREVKFSPGQAGSYLYWASTSGRPLDHRSEAETALSGAFVVDAWGKKIDDRVFVIGLWSKNPDAPSLSDIASVNGKTWPYTERVSYPADEPVHWRVINGSDDSHAMHLHGFYFDLDATGDGERMERYAKEDRQKVVTERIEPGHLFEMTWVPDRPGNWLFHCHMVAHMTVSTGLHPKDETPMEHDGEHEASMGMGGLIIGVHVLPGKKGPEETPKWEATHKVQLVISENPEKIPHYKLAVNDPRIPTKDEKGSRPSLLGPPIVLVRDEPAEIEVKNETKDPTSIHWHGIEVESYYDGVPGWSGDTQKPSPPVPPGDSFVARMTPPRAGTFIYHTHWHDVKQLRNGVYGPLIVLEPGQKYDAEHDRTFVFSVGSYAPFGFLLLANGTPEPDTVVLQAGTRYRFRFINITSNEVDLKVRLMTEKGIAQWNLIARDGADLPAGIVKSGPAELDVTVGATADVEVQVEPKGNAELQIALPVFEGLISQPLAFQ